MFRVIYPIQTGIQYNVRPLSVYHIINQVRQIENKWTTEEISHFEYNHSHKPLYSMK